MGKYQARNYGPTKCNTPFYSWEKKKGFICDRDKNHFGKHSEGGQE